jgi:hypothetical protein
MSVGLGGDGDEVAAIEEVEQTFGVRLDDADAPAWETAGDVFASLLKALPEDHASEAELWPRFAHAISRETGVDPATLVRESPLLANTSMPKWHIGLALFVIWGLAFLFN